MKLLLVLVVAAVLGLVVAQSTTQYPEHNCYDDHRPAASNPHKYELSDLAGNWEERWCEPRHLVFVMAEKCYCGWSDPELTYGNCSDVNRPSQVSPDLDYMFEYWHPVLDVWMESNCHDVFPPGFDHNNQYLFWNDTGCRCDWKPGHLPYLGPPIMNTDLHVDFRLERCSMRIWGEPHIETCSDEGTQTTCFSLGFRTYLDVFFLTITGVNSYRGPTVTALSEITIEFKSVTFPHHVTARYRAWDGNLPQTWDILADNVAEIDRVVLSMETVTNPTLQDHGIRNVPVIVWPYTGVEIIVDTWYGFYQFIMRAPRAAMNTGTGILIQGCPNDELYITDIMPETREISEASARQTCLAVNIPPNTGDMDACIFDVIAMNDVTFADATAMAITQRDITVLRDAERRQAAGEWIISVPIDCTVGVDIEMINQPPLDSKGSMVQPACPFWPPIVQLQSVDGRESMRCNNCTLKSWFLTGNEKRDICMYLGLYSVGQDDPSAYRVVLSDSCASIIVGNPTVFPATFLLEYRAAPMSFRVTYHGGQWTYSPGGSGVNRWVDVALCYRAGSWFTIYVDGESGDIVENTQPDPFQAGVNPYFRLSDNCQLNLCGDALNHNTKYTGSIYWFQEMAGSTSPIDARP